MEVLRFTNEHYEIRVNTASIQSSWRRFKSRIVEDNPLEYCTYKSTCEGKLWLTDFITFRDSPMPIGNGHEWSAQPPVFYETCVYGVSILFHNIEGTPRIVHKLKEVSNLFTSFNLAEGKVLLSGNLDFMNEPGYFALSFSYKPKGGQSRTDTFTFPVVSPKLDTKNDYLHIMQDINREYNELVFQYLTKTFQNLQRSGTSNNDIVWLSIFLNVVEDYVKSVNYIVNRPHLKVQSQVRFDKAERIKRWSPKMCERFVECKQESRLNRAYFRNEEQVTTVNTRENRFVKFSLEAISLRLSAIINKITRKQNDILSDEELNNLKKHLSNLQKLQSNTLFRRVGRFEGFKQESIILQKRTGYAQIYRFWLILRSGLELLEGANSIGVRPVWELYEVWCFLKMREMVGDILNIDITTPSDLFNEDKSTMLNPFNDSNIEHKVRYYHNGNIIELCYQHTYNRRSGEIHTATTEQRPDIVLNIYTNDKHEPSVLTYLYDAKYRVLDDTKEHEDDSEYCDYPPSDAINQMHRYRDAIYYGNTLFEHSSKEIIGGYILFPGRGDKKVRERYYYKSIESVNIGAFPLLPDHRESDKEGNLLREHLTRILLQQDAHAHVKDSIPQRGLHYTDEKPKDKLVYVGTVLNTNPLINEFKENTAPMYYTGEQDTPHNLDLQAVKYFMPIIGGKIGGVYEVKAVQAARKSDKNLHNDNPNDGVRFFFMLGEFKHFGESFVYTQNRVHNAEVMTLAECFKLYNNLNPDTHKSNNHHFFFFFFN